MEEASFVRPETPRQHVYSQHRSSSQNVEPDDSPSSSSDSSRSIGRPPRPRSLSLSSTDDHFPRTAKEAVQWTCEDSASCKLSAVHAGYYSDDFIHYFTRRLHHKAPIINRGYYARKMAIDLLVERFLKNAKRCQIVALGGGLDTRYFNLKKHNNAPELYIEVDYAEVVNKKCVAIKKNIDAFRDVLDANVTIDTSELNPHVLSSSYKLLTVDLEQAETTIALLCKELDCTLPTLFISECVLIYMAPESSDALINKITSTFTYAAFVTYEQITPDDPFGKVMIRNLEAQHLPLKGISKYPSINAQRQRYLDCGCDSSLALTMDDVFKRHIERASPHPQEILDEVEEWHLMSEHYVLVYAAKDRAGHYGRFGFAEGL